MNSEKQQIFIVEGGEVFETYEEYLEFLKNYKLDLTPRRKWKNYLQDDLGDGYEVIFPKMPSKWNARYVEWKIWMEKHIPILRNEIILMGNSLGGMFWAKYLSENNFPVRIKAVFLLAPPFDEIGGGFTLSSNFEKFQKQAKKIFIYHSDDDPVVATSETEKYTAALPSAEKIIFQDKGHFALESFPEFLEKIKSLK